MKDVENLFNEVKKYEFKPRGYGLICHAIDRHLNTNDKRVYILSVDNLENIIASLELIREETFRKVSYFLDNDIIRVEYENQLVLNIVKNEVK